MGYGAEEIYTRWSWRSLGMWKELAERSATTIFRRTGVLWMARDGPAGGATLATLENAGVPHRRLIRAELEARWPQIRFDDIARAIHEPKAEC